MKYHIIDAIVFKSLFMTVENYPEIIELLSDSAKSLLVISELKEYQKHIDDGKKFRMKYTPMPIFKMLTEMLGYAKTADELDHVFNDVVSFFKADIDKPKWWHDKIEPHSGDATFYATPGDTEITQEDIDGAVEEWNKLMPDYGGMLDAKVEVNNA